MLKVKEKRNRNNIFLIIRFHIVVSCLYLLNFFNTVKGDEIMRVHLKKTVGKVSGMTCSNLYNNREYGPLSKGRIVELQKFLETPKEDRCLKCQKIASKFSSYV